MSSLRSEALGMGAKRHKSGPERVTLVPGGAADGVMALMPAPLLHTLHVYPNNDWFTELCLGWQPTNSRTGNVA
jgi:hypothetical protein